MTQKIKFGKHSPLCFAFDAAAYILLGLSVYWGTLLTIFSTVGFISDVRVGSPNVFLLVYASVGLITWLNAGWYMNAFKKTRPVDMFLRFFHENRPVIIFTAALTLLWGALFGLQFAVRLPQQLLSTVHLFSLPWIIGETLMFTVRQGTLRFVPQLVFINEIGFLAGLLFELAAFYYIGKVLGFIQEKLNP